MLETTIKSFAGFSASRPLDGGASDAASRARSFTLARTVLNRSAH